MKLAEQPISSLRGIVPSLTVLNISNCGLKTLQGINVCFRLQFLNADRNQLESLLPLIPLERLSELRVASNALVSLREIPKLKSLVFLDVSSNICVNQADDISPLSGNPKLKFLRLKDTPWSREDEDYISKVLATCPSVMSVDEPNFDQYSAFKSIKRFILSDPAVSSSMFSSKRNSAASEAPLQPHTEAKRSRNGSSSTGMCRGNTSATGAALMRSQVVDLSDCRPMTPLSTKLSRGRSLSRKESAGTNDRDSRKFYKTEKVIPGSKNSPNRSHKDREGAKA